MTALEMGKNGIWYECALSLDRENDGSEAVAERKKKGLVVVMASWERRKSAVVGGCEFESVRSLWGGGVPPRS